MSGPATVYHHAGGLGVPGLTIPRGIREPERMATWILAEGLI